MKKHRFLISLIIVLIISALTSPANAAYNIYVGDTYTCNLGYVSNFKECVWTTSDYSCLDFVGSVSRYSTEVTVKALAKPSYAVPVTIHCQYYYYDLDPVTGRYTYLRTDAKDFQFFIKESTVSNPQSVSVYPSSLSLSVGGGQSLSASVSPSNANQSVTWSTSNYSVASVSSSGYVTAQSAGEAYITATTTNGLTSSCYVSVQSSSSTPTPTSVSINATNFPDETFRAYLLNQSWGKDGLLTASEIQSITSLKMRGIKYLTTGLKSLKGIEYFTALKELYCYENELTSLDVSKNTALTDLNCSYNQLTELNVSKNTALKYLNCISNQLTELDVSKNTALEELYCSNNQLTTLDVSKNTALTSLRCYSNQLIALDVSKNTAIEILDCSRNELNELDVTKNTALTDLNCYFNLLTVLDISKNTALADLACGFNQLTDLDISKNFLLESLLCEANKLSSLDVSKNTKLTDLHCSKNQLTSIDISKNASLEYFTCNNNQLTSLDVSSFDVSEKNSVWRRIHCYGNKIKGSAMDSLINSIPINNSDKVFTIQIIDIAESIEGNVCTKRQVVKIKEKGWRPLAVNGSNWVEYEGSDDVQPQSITLPSTETVMVGETITLTPTITPTDAVTTLTWTSDDETIATVSEGVVTGVKKGQTFINIETDNGKTAVCKLTVTESEIKVTGITLDKTTLTLEVGKTQALNATVKPDDATNKSVTWTSSKTSVATVDNNGKVTAVASGNAKITCTANDDSGVSAICTVTVKAVPESITLQTTATMRTGQMITLTPTITPADAVTTLTWSSDDESIATVSSAGVVTGVKKGQTFINVETDNGKTAYCKLTVTAGEPTAISLPKNVTMMVNQKITLTPTLTPADAETVLTWKSDDESVVRVSADGVLTGVAEGLALVTVSTSNGLTSGACKVKVEPDITGISDVEAEGRTNTPVYTLSGQRIAAPRKGINIVGGKKVIIK